MRTGGGRIFSAAAFRRGACSCVAEHRGTLGGDTGRTPLTVLVVDDDGGFRRVARRLLTVRGFVVVDDVATGEAAFEAVRPAPGLSWRKERLVEADLLQLFSPAGT